jgi:RNA polymerase sigma factor (sigma-70 family)
MTPHLDATSTPSVIDAPLLADIQEYLRRRRLRLDIDPRLHAAWDQFFPRYNAMIRRRVHHYHLESHAAEDVCQEIHLRVCARLEQFHADHTPGYALWTWLSLQILAQVSALSRRRARFHPLDLDAAVRAGQEPADASADPVRLAERGWDQEMVQAVLAQLRARVSAQNYRLLTQRWHEERSVAEVAAQAQLSPEVVSDRLCRLLRKLHALVVAYLGEPVQRHKTWPGPAGARRPAALAKVG